MTHKNIHELFSVAAEQYASGTAISHKDKAVTYSELENYSNRLANFLIERDTPRGSRIAILAADTAEVTTAILGILKAGCVFVPLDPSTPEKRLAAMISEASPRWLIAESEFLSTVCRIRNAESPTNVIALDAERIPPDRQAGCIDVADYKACADVSAPQISSHPDSMCYIYFTSGSTGRPKGIAGRLKGIDHFIRWEINKFGLEAGCRVSQFTSPAFDAWMRDIFTPLCSGGVVCVPDDRDMILDPARLVSWIDEQGINLIHCVPSLFRSILSAPLEPKHFSSLRWILMAGEPLLPSDVGRWSDVFGDRVQLVNLYGPTETTMTKLFYLAKASDRDRRTIPIGKPMDGARAVVIDTKGKICAPGAIGEIYIRTPYRTLGYYNNPELTKEVFIQNPFNNDPNDIVYKTGDLGQVLEDGDIEFLGRRDEQVKIRGVRIELSEIENLLRSNDSLKEATVLAREDTGGNKYLCAYVVLKDGKKLEGLKEFLSKYLPENMVPSAFMLMDALPRTITGKVDKKALPAPTYARSGSLVAPRNPLEELLADIWKQVLGIAQVSIHDDFFQVGGHSLLATQILSQVRAVLNVDVPLRRLFQNPTIAGLAESIKLIGQPSSIPPLSPVARPERVPLSYAQQRLWFVDQLEPLSSAYIVSAAMRLTGTLNVAALDRTINEITRRHESLRTVFPVTDGQPYQLITAHRPTSLPVVDLSQLDHHHRQIALQQVSAHQAETPFDLAKGPLLRVLLVKLDEQEHVAMVSMHHIITDGWSVGVFINEVARLYSAYSRGEHSDLEELEVQYADYAIWQQEWLKGELLDDQLSYWSKQLEGAPPHLDLPIKKPATTEPTKAAGRRQSLSLSADLSRKLRALSSGESVTLFMTLMAGLQALLYRYSGQGDIVIGTPIANRARAETEPVIGFFVNTLALRVKLTSEMTVRELLRQVREVALDAYAHQDLPFERLVEEIKPERDLGRHPVFQVMFVLQNAPRQELELEGLRLEPMGAMGSAAKFEMTVMMTESGEGVSGVIEYDEQQYEQDTIRRMGEHYEAVLEAMAEGADRRVSELEVMSEQESQRVIREWNETDEEWEIEQSVQERFERQVESTPDAVAVVSEAEEVSYRELNERANQLGRYLRRKGVREGDLVGLYVSRGVEMVVSVMGVMKAGGGYVPIEVEQPEERARYIVRDAGMKVVISEECHREGIEGSVAEIVSLDEEREEIGKERVDNLGIKVEAESVSYVIYTSGSTGAPKGVVITHGGVINYLNWCIKEYAVADGIGAPVHSPLGFDLTVTSLFPSLLTGRSIYLVPGSNEVDELITLLRSTSNFSLVKITPAHLEIVNQWLSAEEAAGSTQSLIIGGEALLGEMLMFWRQNAPDTRLINEYGPTETVVGCCTYEVKADDPVTGPVPIGRPIANTQIYVLDSNLQPMPVGVPGELCVSGDGLGQGYLNNPGLTAEKFMPNPFSRSPGARIYRTGDLARFRPDGCLEFLGRIDHQVKIRGFRIELQEIESVLALCPGVREAVAAVNHASPSDKRLAAYVTASAGQELDVAEMKAYLKRKLPDYMVPSAIVILEQMPLTANGKVDRRALPEPEARGEGAVRGGSLSAVEELVAGIWEKVLGVEEVGVEENFFDLGGHSLLATQVVSRVREVMKVEVGVRRMFEEPTVRGFARSIEEEMRGAGAEVGVSVKSVRKERGKTERLPLSYAQQRLWFVDQLEPLSSAYIVSAAMRLTGTLNVAALDRTINEITRRHESLRTVFPVTDGQPYQLITAHRPTSLPVVDLSQLDHHHRQIALQQVSAHQAETPFDLAKGPLLRVLLVKLDEQEHVAMVSMHHIITDGWSVGVFINEVARLYSAYSRGEHSDLEELEVQYADYAIWQQAWLKGELLDDQLSYWSKQLEGAPPHLDLPIKKPATTEPTKAAGRRQSLSLSADLSRKLRALSSGESVTLFMTLMAGLQALLYRYSGQGDIVIGTPIANRARAETEPVIGFFVNTLALRVKLTSEMTVRELLRQVREVALDAYAHQDLPFERLVEEIKPERDLGRHPVFQVMFVLQNAPRQELELEGLRLEPMGAMGSAAKFEMTVMMTESGEGVSGVIEYDEQQYEQDTIRRMGEHYEAVLEAMAEGADRRVSELEVMSEQESQRVIREWNETDEEWEIEQSVQERFERQVESTPDAVAVVNEAEEVSYRELNERANQLGRYLRRKGVREGDLVGLYVSRGVEMVVSVMGVMKAGGGYVPIEVEQPEERARYIVRDAGMKVVISEGRHREGIEGSGTEIVSLDEEREEISKERVDNLGIKVEAESVSYVIYTSGSTGAPKGVVITHGSVINLLMSLKRAIPILTEGPLRVGMNAPLSFDASVKQLIQLLGGHALYIIPESIRQEALALINFIQAESLDVFDCTPSHLSLLLQNGLFDKSQLKLVLIGGESIDDNMWQELAQHPYTAFYNVYGPTECTVDTTVCKIDITQTRPTIGRPIANSQVYVLDAQDLPAPIGVPGELCIGGAGLSRGYLNNPGLTAEKFMPNPFSRSPGARIYRTGDLARFRPDGCLEFLGRIDHQVKIRGFRIELQEIESVLALCPGVREAVAAVNHASPSDKRLIAYVTASAGQELEPAEMKAYLKSKLPDYMVPTAIVILEQMPLTANGKVDRRALPEPEARGEGAVRGGSLSAVEELVAGIWEKVLGVGEVGVEENFFDLGGHSLLATQVVSRVREVMKVEVGVRRMFEEPTVRGFARSIEEEMRGAGAEVGVSVKSARKERGKTERLPLSYAQQRLWFIDQLEPGSTASVISTGMRLTGTLDVLALDRTINEITRRHESLRTVFPVADGQPYQLIIAHRPTSLPVVDLSQLDHHHRQIALQQVSTHQAETPFDLAKGPLLRVLLVKLDEQEHVAMISMHHIITDGWSVGVFINEVARLYSAYSRGEQSDLEELEVQYADYAIWQQEWLKGELLDDQLSYWKRQLGANPPALNLPTDKPRPIVQTFRGATESFFIEKELSESVKTLSRDEGVTLFMTLLSVFKMLLYQYTGQEEIVVGIPIAGRHRIETEELIGCFVNTLAVKSRLSSDLTVRELLTQVREAALEGYAHQDLPFERLVEEVQPERDLSRHPLFQVMFVLQNAPRQELELPGLTLKPISVETKAAKFDLTLFVRESKQGLTGILEYNVDLFEAATIRRWIKHFQNILQNAVANPHKPISELGALTDDELQQIVIDWNETQADYPKEKCLHQLFEEQVKRTGERVAVMHGSRKQTYDELNRKSNQLAHYLKRSGVGPEAIVGIHMDRSIEMLVSILGVLKAGGAYLPLETGSPKDRLALMIEDAGASLILTRGRSQASLPDRAGKIIDWDEQWESISEESEANLANEASPHNLAYVLYTSGSTGQPKGVMIQHQGLVNYLSWCVAAYSVAEGEGAPVHSPIGFDLTVTSLFSPLLAGKTTVLLSDRDGVESLSRILQSGENYSLIKLTPAHLNLLSQGLPDSRAAARVNALIVGGEALRAESLEFWRACAPTTRIINEYGPTETVVGCCVYEIKNGEAITGAVPIGRPIANTQMRILDDNMRPVPIGRIGHLYIGGDGVARGYANQPKLTAEKFVPDPYAKVPGARLYKSGDKARYLPDGAIEFIGRDDDQVKIRGYRLELGEIESVIGAHPDVGQVSVIAREDTPGDKRLVAYLASSAGDQMNINRLRDYLKQKLPDYMLPSNFVVLNSLPLTSTGKVDRRRLPMPSEHRPDLDVSYLGPRTEVEQSIANIWRQVLKIDEPGVNDNFFDLGGNSLLLAQTRAKLVEVFGECVSLVDMFLYPTVSSLSSYLSRSLDEREPLKLDFARSEKRSAAVEELRELRRRHRSVSEVK